jgi:hypothetical protein
MVACSNDERGVQKVLIAVSTQLDDQWKITFNKWTKDAMKKIFWVSTLLAALSISSGCVWFLWHGQVLAKSNQRLDFTVFYVVPNAMIAISCMNYSSIGNPESENIALYRQYQWAMWVVDRVDVNGNDLPDGKGKWLGSAITETGSTPAFVDSAGTAIYAATFKSIRIGGDSPPWQDSCWTTSGYAMDNRAPYKAKIVASTVNAQGTPIDLNVYTAAEANCIATQIGGGASVGNAFNACSSPTRKVLHLYANQLHAPL